nr:hypothetical protein [uncultured Allomuricauda sp.]
MKWKKSILLAFGLLLSIWGCDPTESLEAYIMNSSNESLNMNFVSSELLTEFMENREILIIPSNERRSYQRIGVDEFIGQAGLSLSVFDSIYISNNANEILKIYKPDSPGKNIYNIDQYWTVRETGKNHFEYTYTITDEDIGN